MFTCTSLIVNFIASTLLTKFTDIFFEMILKYYSIIKSGDHIYIYIYIKEKKKTKKTI
jgi:hypothetical protein